MRLLKDALPSDGERVLYVYYDFDSTQNKRYSDKATIHVHNLVGVQLFCSQCEGVEHCGHCVRCGKPKYSFWDDPVGKLLLYLQEQHPLANKIVVIAHNAKAFDLHFILNIAMMLKWQPELIMNRLKIMLMKM